MVYGSPWAQPWLDFKSNPQVQPCTLSESVLPNPSYYDDGRTQISCEEVCSNSSRVLDHDYDSPPGNLATYGLWATINNPGSSVNQDLDLLQNGTIRQLLNRLRRLASAVTIKLWLLEPGTPLVIAWAQYIALARGALTPVMPIYLSTAPRLDCSLQMGIMELPIINSSNVWMQFAFRNHWMRTLAVLG